MKLNRTGSNWTELERNKINENWRIIEGNYNDVVDKVSEEAFDKVVNSAKLNWKEPVDKYADLPGGASEGDTRMVRDSGKVYRFNGEVWQEIQQIDAGPVNELDARLTTQLAEETQRRRQDINRLDDKKADKTYVDGEIEMLDGEKADKGALAQVAQSKRDKSVEIEMKDLSQDVKEAMTGGSVAVVGDDAVGTSNLKDGAVTKEKLYKNILTNTPWISGEEKNLDYVFDEGNYMVGTTVTNNPFNNPAYLTVNRYKVHANSDETTVKQTLTNVEDVELSSLYRMIRYDETNASITWMTNWRGEDNLTEYIAEKQINLTTNFNGKIKGENFIPHEAKKGSFNISYDGDNLITPSPYDHDWLEFSQEDYDNLNKKTEGTRYKTKVNGEYACHLFSFNVFEFLKNNGSIALGSTIDEIRDKILYFNIKWKGRGSEGVRLHYWSSSTSRYARFTIANPSLPPRELSYGFNLVGSTGVAGNQLDDDGFLHILIRSDESSNGDGVYVDTFDVEVNHLIVKKEVLMTDVDIDNHNNGVDKAYDKLQDRLKVSVEESTTRKLLEEYIRFERQGAVVETLFDGELEPDETINDLYSLYRGEKETRILVSTDKDGRMIVGAGPFDGVENYYTNTSYPDVYNIEQAYNENNPLHVLPIYRGSIEVDENTTWEQAYQHRQLNDFRILFRNTASEKANVTIKIMRIFK